MFIAALALLLVTIGIVKLVQSFILMFKWDLNADFYEKMSMSCLFISSASFMMGFLFAISSLVMVSVVLFFMMIFFAFLLSLTL